MQSANFQLGVGDLVDARLHIHQRRPLIKALWLALIVVAAGCSLLIILLVFSRDWSEALSVAWWLAGALALMAWSVLGNRWLLPPSARKQLARDKALQGDNAIAWDAEVITMSGANGQSRWAWGDFYKWQESAGGFLLWRSDRLYTYIPKRCLSGDQTAEIRTILRRQAATSAHPALSPMVDARLPVSASQGPA